MERTNFNSGVYIILNKINGKVYVGSALNIKSRLYNHKRDLKNNIHVNKYLQNAWNKYEENNFEFNVILYCSNKNRLIYEQEMIDKYLSLHLAYNMYPKAGSPLGSHHSQKTIEKQSKVRKKYWETHEHPYGKKNSFYGKTHTKESKEKSAMSHNKLEIYKGNQYAKGNRFKHTSEEIERMKNSWTPELRKQASIRATKRYQEGFGIAKINNKFKIRDDKR
jgi:group I intron endonuclease